MQEQAQGWDEMQQGVPNVQSGCEVLRGLSEEEAVVRAAHQEVVVLDILMPRLSVRDYSIVRLRAGADGDPLTLQEIADKIGLTRQRVQAILSRIEKSTPEWGELTSSYPSLSGRIPTQTRSRRGISALRRYCKDANNRTFIQYEAIHKAVGLPMPEHRKMSGPLMDEMETMVAIWQDYRVSRFGDRWKVCGVCLKPQRPSEFYPKQNGLPGYQCKDCNRVRCRTYQKSRREGDRNESNPTNEPRQG